MTREQRLLEAMERITYVGMHQGLAMAHKISNEALAAYHAAPDEGPGDGELREILLKVWCDLEAGCKNSMLLEKAIDLLDAARAHTPKPKLEDFEWDRSTFVELPVFKRAHTPKDDSLYSFSCCGGNDDEFSKNGHHQAHTMDCDEHPSVIPTPKAAESGEYVSWTDYHGCFTGDCPHTNANECVAEIRKFAKEIDDENRLASRPKAEGRIYSGVPYLKYDFGTTKPKSITPADGKYFEVIVREVLERGE